MADRFKSDIDNIVKLSVIAGALIVSLSIAYYFVIFLPQKEQARIEQHRQEREETEKKARQSKIFLQACLDNAYKGYSADWDSACQSQGKAVNCTLYGGIPKGIEDHLKQDKEECFKKYPQ